MKTLEDIRREVFSEYTKYSTKFSFSCPLFTVNIFYRWTSNDLCVISSGFDLGILRSSSPQSIEHRYNFSKEFVWLSVMALEFDAYRRYQALQGKGQETTDIQNPTQN